MYKVLGIMSGTSLDGLDLCLCEFEESDKGWTYKIIRAKTLDYNKEWFLKLQQAHELNFEQLYYLHMDYARYISTCIKNFIREEEVDLIASHGHTIYHQADKGFSFQLGNPQLIACLCGIKTIGDFRTMDILLGGQGAPLVPMGDRVLFKEYQACVNLGGFSNISFEIKNERIAFDICPLNIVLNSLCQKLGKDYDENGEIAAAAKTDNRLLTKLNSIDFYQKDPPKSLGREWVESWVNPILENSPLSTADQIATFTEHIAFQIAGILNKNKIGESVLFTGGGAKNNYLMKRIEAQCKCRVILPSDELINFKEALIFAFLGVLRYKNQINTLKSVTGAKKDSCAGVLFLPQ